MAAWLHDIGKVTATTIKTDADERHWSVAGPEGKIRSLRHEEPEHYGPEIEKLRQYVPNEIQEIYDKNKELFDFLIQRHMDVSKGGFPKFFVTDNFENGVLKNEEKIKLLLVLIYADKMGRSPYSHAAIEKNDKALAEASAKSIEKQSTKKKSFSGSPLELISTMRDKNVPDNIIAKNVKNKFGLSDEEVSRMML